MRDRDKAAFSSFYDGYCSLVYTLAIRILRQEDLAQEATQRVFLYLWEHPELYDQVRGEFGPWLMLVARSRAIDLLRRRVMAAKWEDLPLGEDPSPELLLVESDKMSSEKLNVKEDYVAVQNALASLSEGQRRVIEVAYFEGLTQSEIAEKLQEPLGTVKMSMRLGMRKLADILGAEIDNEP